MVMVKSNVSKKKMSGSDSISNLWEDAPTITNPLSTCIEIYGDTDTGRTTLAFTAPGPIAYFHHHEKWMGLVQKFSKKKKIKMMNFGCVFRGTTDHIQSQASEMVDKFESALSDAYTWAGSIIIDKHTDLWTLYQLARLGSLSYEGKSSKDSRKGQLIYTEINARWSSMLNMYKEQEQKSQVKSTGRHTNLILVGQTAPEYKKKLSASGKSTSEATGRTVRSGQKHLHFFCDLIVRTSYDKRDEEFIGTIEKPWFNNDMRGFKATDDMLNFPSILGLVTGTDPEEWGG